MGQTAILGGNLNFLFLVSTPKRTASTYNLLGTDHTFPASRVFFNIPRKIVEGGSARRVDHLSLKW